MGRCHQTSTNLAGWLCSAGTATPSLFLSHSGPMPQEGPAGGLVAIFAWRMPICGWIDFTSDAGFGPPVRRVEMWSLPSSVLQVSMGDHGMSLDSKRPSYRLCRCLHGSPFLICGGSCRCFDGSPWFPPGQTGMSVTLMVSTSINQTGSATIALLTIHLSDGTGRGHSEGMTGLQVLYGRSNSQLQIHPCIGKTDPAS